MLLVLLVYGSGERVSSPEELAKEAHLANINALLIFTSQDGLNTGLYHFTKVDVDMQIYNLPFIYHFDSSEDVNFFVLGNVGYSRVFTQNEVVLGPQTILNSDSNLQTYTGGIGGGLRFNIEKFWSILVGSELIYSRSGISTKHEEQSPTDPIVDFFGSKFNDNLSYKLFGETIFRPHINYFEPYLKLGYNFFDTKSAMDLENLTTFSSQSSLLSLSVGGTTEPFAKADYGHMTLETYFNTSYLQGDVVKSIRFDTYAKVGSVLYLYHRASPSWIERYFFEVSTIKADGLEGYNFGLGFSIDY